MDLIFEKSATHPRDFPQPLQVEYIFLGRSNAGKSSLINALFRSQLARVSQSPGKTRAINFFCLRGPQRKRVAWVVDVPGYGFAKRSMTERKAWQSMVEDYLKISNRGKRLAIILIDIQRNWSSDEDLLLDFLNWVTIPYWFVFTKLDRLNKKEKNLRQHYWQQIIPKDTHQFFVSSTTGDGIDLLFRQVSSFLTAGARKRT